MKVLLVEDEKKIRDWVARSVREAGHVVDSVGDGNDAWAHLLSTSYDALILDIMIPGRDGLSLLRSLRAKGINVPVLMISARGELDEKIEGLDLGADDYLAKPFHVDELLARLRAITRRTDGDHLSLIEVSCIRMNLATREVWAGQRKIELTAREFALLELFLRAPERVFSRSQILDRVWQYDFDPGTNLVDVYVRRLRQKLGSPESSCLEAVRGVGYRLLRLKTR